MRTQSYFGILVMLMMSAFYACTTAAEYDVVIRDGTIYDGSGAEDDVVVFRRRTGAQQTCDRQRNRSGDDRSSRRHVVHRTSHGHGTSSGIENLANPTDVGRSGAAAATNEPRPGFEPGSAHLGKCGGVFVPLPSFGFGVPRLSQIRVHDNRF